jgi:hypothetical protein
VFGVDQNTRSPVWWRGDGTGWRYGEQRILPPGANLPAEPVAAVCASPDNIDVFAAGAGNTPWWWHWNGLIWSTSPLIAFASLPAERIAAVSAAPGRLDVFAVGMNTHLCHWWRIGPAAWLFEDLGGDLPAGGVSAVSWGPNRIDVFAASRAPGNPMQHWWWQGGAFSRPENLGGNLAPGTVGAVSHAADRLDVFGVTRDQRVAHFHWDGQFWTTGLGYRGENIPAGDVSAVVRAPHRLDVFVVGAGNTLRQWPGGGLEGATTQPWSNLATNHQVNPAGHVSPDSLQELVTIVEEAERLGKGVRAVGTSWSNSDVAVSPAYVVETDRLNGVLTDVLSTSLNARAAGRQLVHVEAGIKLHQLNDFLDSRNLALKTMGGASGQSLAGVLSTGAHGMDIEDGRGTIPDMVRAVHLVGPGGVQHWIEPSQGLTEKAALGQALGLPGANIHYDDDWFNSVLVAVGSMGIIYSAIIEVDPQYDLVSTTEAVDWLDMKAKLRKGDPFKNNRGVQVVINPYPSGGSRQCYLTTRRQAPFSGLPGPGGALPPWLLEGVSSVLMTTLTANRNLIPITVNGLTSQQQPVGTVQATGHVVMGDAKPPPALGLAVEIAFDATNPRYLEFVDAALDILKSAYEGPDARGYLGWISLRFQGRSRAYLSAQHATGRTCTVEFAAVWRTTGAFGGGVWPDTPVLLALIEAEGRKFGGIQHWGMFDHLNSSDVTRAYPRLNAWRRVRWALTDGGKVHTFDSDFTRRCGLSNPPRPATSDFDGDGRTDIAVWRPSSGLWYIIDSSTGVGHEQAWGETGDIPVPGDYDGDGRTDIAVWRPSSGLWYIIDSSTGVGHEQAWGETGDIPVPGTSLAFQFA